MPKFAGLVRVDRHLGEPDQAADANLVAETGGKWTSAHRGQGRAYIAVRLKITAEAFPSGPPNIAAIVEGADTILDPRTGATGWSDNPALCLAWYITASFGWRASWDDIDIPCLIAAANVCDEIMGTAAGTAERRYTCNGTLSLAEGKIAITEKLVAAMAGALVVSGGRFFIHAGAPALPVATLTSDDLRGDVTIQGSRARRDLFNGVRAVYVEPSANWQPTDAPPLLASNYVAEDGGEAIYTDLEFPLTTSVSTVQRLMKVALERNRRQRTVAFPANLSALRLRPWEGATVALDRLVPFPARITGWSLAQDGGVDLVLAEEDAAVWDWNPAVDERATGDSPSVVLPNPGRISAPASIAVDDAGHHQLCRPGGLLVGGRLGLSRRLRGRVPAGLGCRVAGLRGGVRRHRGVDPHRRADRLQGARRGPQWRRVGLAVGPGPGRRLGADRHRHHRRRAAVRRLSRRCGAAAGVRGQQRPAWPRPPSWPPSRPACSGIAPASPPARPAGTGCAASRPRATSRRFAGPVTATAL